MTHNCEASDRAETPPGPVLLWADSPEGGLVERRSGFDGGCVEGSWPKTPQCLERMRWSSVEGECIKPMEVCPDVRAQTYATWYWDADSYTC